MNGQYEMAEFTAELFLPRVGELFAWERSRGRTGEGKAWMRLIEVTRYRAYGEGRREPFSLLFVLQGQPELESGLHTLADPSFEPCELLLSRVTVPADERNERGGIHYEAVFS